jgi:hypothetical protein
VAAHRANKISTLVERKHTVEHTPKAKTRIEEKTLPSHPAKVSQTEHSPIVLACKIMEKKKSKYAGCAHAHEKTK